MTDLITLLRNKQCTVKYSKEYDETLTGASHVSDDELLENVIELYCCDKQLTSLPQLPNCTELWCSNNQLTSLPQLPKCNKLYCYNNQLTSLPQLPNCKWLNCYNNQLTSLPQLPNCTNLYCYNNQLTCLPVLNNLYYPDYSNNCLPVLINICYSDWSNNCLPFDELDKWKIIWKARRLYLQIKYFRLWYKFMLQSKAKKKSEIHLELKYSPNLQFYKNTEEYEHWHNCLQQSH